MELPRESSERKVCRKRERLNKGQEAGLCTHRPGKKGLCLLRAEGPSGEMEEGQTDPLTLLIPVADTAALSHARLRSNSTGARHSTPRALDAGRGRRLGGPRDSAPEKSRTSPSGGRVPKSASVSALSLIITAGDAHGPASSLLVCPCPF